jgi:hypothetical protein
MVGREVLNPILKALFYLKKGLQEGLHKNSLIQQAFRESPMAPRPYEKGELGIEGLQALTLI